MTRWDNSPGHQMGTRERWRGKLTAQAGCPSRPAWAAARPAAAMATIAVDFMMGWIG